MKNYRYRSTLEKLLEGTDIKINGSRPWDIQVHNERFYPRVLAGGSLGLGESYIDGWWDCGRLDQFMERILRMEMVSILIFFLASTRNKKRELTPCLHDFLFLE